MCWSDQTTCLWYPTYLWYPRSWHVIKEQCPLRGVDTPSTDCSEELGDLRRGRGRHLCLRRQVLLTNLFSKDQGCVGPRLAQLPPLCFSPDPTGNQASKGTKSQDSPGGPLLDEPALAIRANSSVDSSPLGPFHWDGISLKRMGQYGILGPIYAPCTSGQSNGAFEPPRASLNHNFIG